VFTARLLALIVASLLAASCGAAPGSAGAAVHCDLIASPDGGDRAAGTLAEPLRSPQGLVDRLRAGQTGCLRGGVYTKRTRQGYVARFGHGGRRGAPLVLRSYPGERATLSGVVYVPRHSNYVTIQAVNIEDRTSVERDQQLTVQINAKATTLRDDEITNGNRKTCVILGAAGAGVARETTIVDSVLHHCGDPKRRQYDHAIYSAHARDLRLTGNVIRRASAYAVHLYPDTKGAVVRNNLIVDNGGGVIFAGEGSEASSRNVVEHNLIAGSHSYGDVSSYWGQRRGTGNVARGNCLSQEPDDAGDGYSLASTTLIAGGDYPASCAELVGAALASRVPGAR
jgi:hypothetical protein